LVVIVREVADVRRSKSCRTTLIDVADRLLRKLAGCQHGVVIEIVAHRGSREGAAEHTLSAYRKAILDGADALECDVRLTADGHLVCLHDRRVDFVSDGRGVVSTLPLADLGQLQFGSRRPWRMLDKYRAPAGASTPSGPERADSAILTLRQLLELTTSAARPVGLSIETKHPTRYRALVEERLVELLDEFGLLGVPRSMPASAAGAQIGARPAIRVMSFAAVSLRRMRRLAPELDLVLLLGRIPPHLRDGHLPEGVRAAGVDVGIVRRDPDYVARAHAQGNAVYVWTVNSEADADLCQAAGVDALITDRPLGIRRHVLEGRTAGSA
jgi:glycerophosphoryl diester phosphodiesterase